MKVEDIGDSDSDKTNRSCPNKQSLDQFSTARIPSMKIKPSSQESVKKKKQ